MGYFPRQTSGDVCLLSTSAGNRAPGPLQSTRRGLYSIPSGDCTTGATVWLVCTAGQGPCMAAAGRLPSLNPPARHPQVLATSLCVALFLSGLHTQQPGMSLSSLAAVWHAPGAWQMHRALGSTTRSRPPTFDLAPGLSHSPKNTPHINQAVQQRMCLTQTTRPQAGKHTATCVMNHNNTIRRMHYWSAASTAVAGCKQLACCDNLNPLTTTAICNCSHKLTTTWCHSCWKAVTCLERSPKACSPCAEPCLRSMPYQATQHTSRYMT